MIRQSVFRCRAISLALIVVPLVYAMMMLSSASTSLFQIDDPQEFRYVAETDSILSILGTDVFHFFRPVKNILFVLFSRLAPFGIFWCHIVGVLIAILSFFSVRALCRRILGTEEKALLAASVWLFSPTLVSSAAWLSSINIVAMVAFATGAISLHDSAWDSSHYRASRTLLAGLCLFLALLSYECAVSAVPLLFLFDIYLRPRRVRTKGGIEAHILYWTIAALYLVLRHIGSAKTGTGGLYFIDTEKWQIIVSSPWFFAQHFLLWFWPFGRLFILGSYRWGGVPVWELAICWLLLLSVVFWCLTRIRKHTISKYCLLFFFVGFAPTSNCLGFGNGPFGDYYMSLASIGLAAWVAEQIISAISHTGKGHLPDFALALVLAITRIWCLAESASWSAAWGNGTEVIAASVRNRPEFFSNKVVLAMSIIGKDRYEEALNLCDQAEEFIGPDSRHMANIFALRGEYEMLVNRNDSAALLFFDEMLRVDSSEEVKKKRHFYRGKVFETLRKDVRSAEREYELAVAGNDPNLSAAHRLALVKDRSGRPEEAFAIWERIVRIKPDDDSALWHLAMACRKRGDERRASVFESRALKLGGR